MTTSQHGALVLFSGGQDSTVCLAWALNRYAHVETIGFDYGQRHHVELQQREIVRQALVHLNPDFAARLGEDHRVDVPSLKALGETAMTHNVAIKTHATGLPTTFVPGRNLVFLTLAGALAWRRGFDVLVGGMCETDYSGYPDCRHDTLVSQERTLSLGLEHRLRIETPLMSIDKAGTWALAHELGGDALINLIVEDTHTCYLGERTHRQDWGYGCGACPACDLRAAGWRRWRAGVAR